tara:strand:- start:8807 stop:9364 length:558 start_codon:yes stop_codon:yes gene_type:complete
MKPLINQKIHLMVLSVASLLLSGCVLGSGNVVPNRYDESVDTMINRDEGIYSKYDGDCFVRGVFPIILITCGELTRVNIKLMCEVKMDGTDVAIAKRPYRYKQLDWYLYNKNSDKLLGEGKATTDQNGKVEFTINENEYANDASKYEVRFKHQEHEFYFSKAINEPEMTLPDEVCGNRSVASESN